MFGSKTLKAALTGTTALIGVTFLAQAAMAAPFNITTAGNGERVMAAGESLFISSSGSITGTTTGVKLGSNRTATLIQNSGTVSGTNTGIKITSTSHLTGAITNFGTIIGGDTAILVNSSSTINGGITNSGSGVISGDIGINVEDVNSDISGLVSNAGFISATDTGIKIANNGDISGGIDNTGTISGGHNGINVANTIMSGDITNHVGATIHGNTNAGILVGAVGTISGTIDNAGTISGAQFGILVQTDSSISHVITNEATGVISGGTVAGGTGINIIGAGSNIAGISNAGTIQGGATAGAGIHLGASTTSGEINNTGTITGVIGINNAGTIAGGTLSSSVAVLVSGTHGFIHGGITNSGTISSGGQAISVLAGGTITGGVTNTTTGVIHGYSSTGTGINVGGAGSNITGGIHNSGTIEGGSNFGAGINIGTGATIAGGITDTTATGVIEGALGIDNAGTINGAAQAILVSAAGTITGEISNRDNGVITGANTGIEVTGAGSAISGGILNVGHITGTGDYGINVTAGGTITSVDNAVTIDSTDPNNEFVSAGPGVIHGSFGGINVSGAGSNINGFGVFNAGTISGDDGISVVNHGDISGGIDNEAVTGLVGGVNTVLSAGLISGVTNGIFVGDLGNISGGIDNHGAITGGQYGIQIASSSNLTGTVTNEVGATIHGGKAGILVTGAGTEFSGGLVNHGTVSGNSSGIRVEAAAHISGGIDNFGSISGDDGIVVTGAGSQIDGIHNESGGTISGSEHGIHISNHGSVVGDITNDTGGTISSNDGNGISLQTSGSVTGGITNHGTIESSDTALFINHSSVAGAITNSGLISGTTDAGIRLDNHASVGSISNSGHINGTWAGVAIQGSSSVTGAVTNTGTIHSSNGDAIVVEGSSDITGGIHNNADGIINGDFGGIYVSNAKISGGITNAADATIEGGGFAIDLFDLTGATPININGGRIIGDVTDNDPTAGFSPVHIGGDFTTEGNFTVSSLDFSAPSILTISGDNTISVNHFAPGTGTLNFAINSNAAFGHVVIGGAGSTAANLTGTTITAEVDHNSTLTNGTDLKIIQGDAVHAVTGAPADGTLVGDNSYLWNFAVEDGVTGGGNSSDLFLEALLAHPNIPGGNNDVFQILENETGSTNPQIQEILANLNSAGSQAKVDSILSSATPTVDGSDYTASVDVMNDTLDLADTRLADLRTGGDAETGMAAGDMAKGFSAWVEVFGQHTNQSDRDNVAGYNSNTWGGAAGIDTKNISDTSTVGVALSYGRTTANSDNANDTDTSIDSYQATLYGDYDLMKDTYLNGMAGYTWGNVNTDRHHVGGTNLTAHGDFSTQTISARAELGRDFDVQNAHDMTLTPNVLAQWANFDPDSYTESGAGGADLRVDGKTLDTFELGGGVKAGWSFKNADGSWLKPQLHAGYRYNFGDTQVEDTTSFVGGGAAFQVPGAHESRSTINLGGSLKFLTTRNWTLTADYNFDWKSDYNSNSGFLRAAYKF